MKKKLTDAEAKELEEKLKRFSPGSDRSVFKVPEEYFEGLPSNIQHRIHSTEERPFIKWFREIFSSRKLWQPVLASLTVVVLVFLFWPVNRVPLAESASTSDTANLKIAYDASYAGESVHDDYVMMNDMIDSLEMTNATISFDLIKDDSITDDDIRNYLKEQELDTELLAQL